jgi:hypothetical protein
MGRKSTISRLPEQVKSYIEGKLAEGRLTLDELITDLQQRFPAHSEAGDLPSKSAVQRYGQKLERRLSAIRASTEAAKIIHAQIDDKEDARSGAITGMLQAEIFESIMDLQEAEDMDPAERLSLLSNAAKHTATLTRSSVYLKKFQAEVEAKTRQELLAEQTANLQKIAKAQGMSQEHLDFWIKDFLGVR